MMSGTSCGTRIRKAACVLGVVRDILLARVYWIPTYLFFGQDLEAAAMLREIIVDYVKASHIRVRTIHTSFAVRLLFWPYDSWKEYTLRRTISADHSRKLDVNDAVYVIYHMSYRGSVRDVIVKMDRQMYNDTVQSSRFDEVRRSVLDALPKIDRSIYVVLDAVDETTKFAPYSPCFSRALCDTVTEGSRPLVLRDVIAVMYATGRLDSSTTFRALATPPDTFKMKVMFIDDCQEYEFGMDGPDLRTGSSVLEECAASGLKME
jgi:hypothetical protein